MGCTVITFLLALAPWLSPIPLKPPLTSVSVLDIRSSPDRAARRRHRSRRPAARRPQSPRAWTLTATRSPRRTPTERASLAAVIRIQKRSLTLTALPTNDYRRAPFRSCARSHRPMTGQTCFRPVCSSGKGRNGRRPFRPLRRPVHAPQAAWKTPQWHGSTLHPRFLLVIDLEPRCRP